MDAITTERPRKPADADASLKPNDETRQRLIEAAGEVFAEAGYQAATVRDICARAGANVAAVNYHFGDKLGLYIEVLKSAAEENERPILDQAMNASTPEEALRLFLHGMIRLTNEVGRPSRYVRVMLHELVALQDTNLRDTGISRRADDLGHSRGLG